VADSYEHGKEPSGSIQCGEFLTIRVTISFSRRVLVHVVTETTIRVENFSEARTMTSQEFIQDMREHAEFPRDWDASR